MHPNLGAGGLRVTDTHPEHKVAWLELRYGSANRFRATSEIHAGSRNLWFAQAGHEANEVRPTLHRAAVQRIERSRVDFYQDLVVVGNWLLDVLDLDNFRRTVSVADSGFHWG